MPDMQVSDDSRRAGGHVLIRGLTWNPVPRQTTPDQACGGYDVGVVRFVRLNHTRAVSAAAASIRPLSQGIQGSDTEKQFFFSFRRATEAGVAMHLCGVSSFWTEVAPRLGHVDDAVKHALVALGATHHLHRTRRRRRRDSRPCHPDGDSLATKRLELFSARQYNRAIEEVYAHIASNSPRSTILVLVCCLIFISLEFLRPNNGAAIAHLQNGIQIIQSVMGGLDHAAFAAWARELAMSEADVWDMIAQFRNVESALNVFSNDVSLTLGLRLRRASRPRRQPHPLVHERIASVADGYRARTEFMNDVTARYSELRRHQGDAAFWAQRHMQRELRSLRRRASRIMAEMEALWVSPEAPRIGTWSSYSSRMDWLLVSSGRTLAELIPFGVHSFDKVSQSPYIQSEVTRGVSLAAKMHLEHAATGMPPSEFSLETGIIAVMYWAWVFSTRPETKATAVQILQDLDKREGPWDADEILSSLPSVVTPRLLVS
ncbi:uncharacterized protein MAM_06502 [Metarhizium album ARSEF 1941]|uniref:C6 zinc finger domain protein n=1 Tax=Metarhizium album (strain ARSEF 1941) TaxID=1081103 RepID=A0A0B2WI10_METAS|nr:uncharacterized protein MAM_06502 [Metarhizium album ARSEF 1941]KHN95661.1 hypothetical protein MAM_06502 [Metarhizium album ARSEF 1941]